MSETEQERKEGLDALGALRELARVEDEMCIEAHAMPWAVDAVASVADTIADLREALERIATWDPATMSAAVFQRIARDTLASLSPPSTNERQDDL